MSKHPRDMIASPPLGRPLQLLLILASFDLLLIALHCSGKVFPAMNIDFFSIEHDRGLAEFFQYAQELFVIVALALTGIRYRDFRLFSWGLLFLYLLGDDAFSIHENVGMLLSQRFEFHPPFIQPKDLGELLVSGIAGLILFSGIGLCYLRGSAYFKALTHDLFMLLGMLVFFGVVVDMVHSGVGNVRKVTYLLSLLEDGGEMFMMSVIAAYSLYLYQTVPADTRSFTNAAFAGVWKRIRRS